MGSSKTSPSLLAGWRRPRCAPRPGPSGACAPGQVGGTGAHEQDVERASPRAPWDPSTPASVTPVCALPNRTDRRGGRVRHDRRQACGSLGAPRGTRARAPGGPVVRPTWTRFFAVAVIASIALVADQAHQGAGSTATLRPLVRRRCVVVPGVAVVPAVHTRNPGAAFGHLRRLPAPPPAAVRSLHGGGPRHHSSVSVLPLVRPEDTRAVGPPPLASCTGGALGNAVDRHARWARWSDFLTRLHRRAGRPCAPGSSQGLGTADVAHLQPRRRLPGDRRRRGGSSRLMPWRG